MNDPWQDPSPRKVLRRGGQGGVLGTGSASLHPNAPAVAAGAVAPIVPGFNSWDLSADLDEKSHPKYGM